ncbi:MAG: DMT family transporter [Flavobacteriaceae bacterium]|jgi:drug/metabolite transporter (DMT)-like permease|tara:strand:- start:761 stop:1621 length:861 start_codon:yes stop_codon:yes gene_type:complete
MQTKQYLKNLIQLNFAVLIISTSGTLGRYIELPVPLIILLRALIGGVFLYLFCKWKKLSFKIQKKDRKTIFFSGVLMGLHWITYFISLKLSSVAIGMLSVFTYPIITTFLEPLMLNSKFKKSNLLLGLMVLVGIYFLAPEISLENDQFKAIGFGVFSAFCYSIRNIYMKAKSSEYEGSILMVYQLIIVSVLLSPVFLVYDMNGLETSLPAILILALLTTATGHTLFIYSFRNFSISTASIISGVQPVYGIIIGMIVLGEYPALSTIFGGVMILGTVLIESIRNFKE